MLSELRAIKYAIKQLGRIMTASIDQVRADYKEYAQGLKAQRDAAIEAAEAALAREEASIEALRQFQADDEATDASDLLAQREADAEAFRADLEELKAQDEVPEPDPTPGEEVAGEPE